MKQFFSTPSFDDAPDGLFERGHLWILEHVAGVPIRFQLAASGAIRFGNRNRVFQDAGDIPLYLRHATRHVRESLDRQALRGAVEDVESITFFGVATTRTRIAYDWDRTPSFLGTDVWDADAGAGASAENDGTAAGKFRPPDAIAAIFDRLGLTPINDLDREVNARDFDPTEFTIPDSAWYDGPAAGVVVRNKVGDRAWKLHPSLEGEGKTPGNGNELISTDRSSSDDTSVDRVIAEFVTQDRLHKLAVSLETAGRPVTADALYERTLEDVGREVPWLVRGAVDGAALRSGVAKRTRTYVDEQ